MIQPHEVIWVTGASSGIGRELCQTLAGQGCTVIASGRDTQKLASLVAANSNIIPLPFDLSDPQACALAEVRLLEITTCLDRVIVNAGCCEYLGFPNPDWSAIARVMNVNFCSAVKTVEIALPLLRQSKLPRGHIIGVVSQVIFAPFSRAEAYGASKAALDYFFDSLRVDLEPESIDVTAVYPGFVDTPLTQKNDFPMPLLMTPERAAACILKGIESRSSRCVFPKRLYWLLKLSKIFPRWWRTSVVAPKKSQREL